MADKIIWWVGAIVCVFSTLGFLSWLIDRTVTHFCRNAHMMGEFLVFVSRRSRRKAGEVK